MDLVGVAPARGRLLRHLTPMSRLHGNDEVRVSVHLVRQSFDGT